MKQYNVIAESKEYTVLSEYTLSAKKSEAYQSEGSGAEAEWAQIALRAMC